LQAGASWSSQWQPEVPLYDVPAPRQGQGQGLSGLVVKAWKALGWDSLAQLRVAGSLEELLGCRELFGRLLSLRRDSSAGQGGAPR
jgi:hypothetical protein